MACILVHRCEVGMITHQVWGLLGVALYVSPKLVGCGKSPGATIKGTLYKREKERERKC